MTQIANETVAVEETGSNAASLYVGELDAGVTEAMLFELFNIVGPVASIRVCRDAVTRRSLGYAYVNYHNRSDAEHALESLNYTDIKGRPCRIMWSQRDPALRKTGAGNIFIKNLHSSIDHKVLHDTFSAFGNIMSCKVAMDGGVSKGYGFVHYETQEAAEAAIKAVNGMLLHNKQVYVGHHVPKKERETKTLEQKQKFTNVYVKNLDASITSDDFKNMFSRFGDITSAVVATDATTGESKGFGFVNFETHEAAAAAVGEMNDTDHFDKKLYVGRAQKKEEREAELKQQYEQAKAEKQNKYQGVNLYIKNLELDMDDEKLRAAFERFGPITSAKIMRDEKGDSKGFGFVCYTTPDDAAKAAADMNGRMLGTKPIYVALAQRKDVRKSQLEAQMAQRMRMPQMPFFYPSLGRGVFPPPVPRPRWPAMPFAAAAPIPAVGRAQQPPRQVVRPVKKKKDVLSAAALAAAAPGQQKQMLGEALFPLISQRQPEQAGKITGMLLEMDNAELLHLLEAPEALDAKVDEAVLVLKQHALAK